MFSHYVSGILRPCIRPYGLIHAIMSSSAAIRIFILNSSYAISLMNLFKVYLYQTGQRHLNQHQSQRQYQNQSLQNQYQSQHPLEDREKKEAIGIIEDGLFINKALMAIYIQKMGKY